MNKGSKIYIAGHRGMVGSAIVRQLASEGYQNLLLRSSDELDLIDQSEVSFFFENERPDYVFLAAAKVGGIMANNSFRAEFLYENLMIQSNVIHASYKSNVKKLLFLGSSCIYPKLAPQPLKEEYLLTGLLEPTNEPYAIAKIAGIKMCDAYRSQYGSHFISAMPTNLYGPNDNYDLNTSHVLPALIRKMVEAKANNEDKVVIWGTGAPLREFMHVDDLAEVCLLLMKRTEVPGLINVGSGEEVSIKQLAEMIKAIVGFDGELVFDHSKPEGTPRKLMDSDTLKKMGWQTKITLREGLVKEISRYKGI
jgi:GDP-L-fucose synthase